MERRKAAFGATVTLGATVMAGISWETVLLGWALGTALLFLPKKRRSTSSAGANLGTILGGVALLAAVLQLAEGAFPEDSTFPAVSLGLMLLLWRATASQQPCRTVVTNGLGVCLAILFGAILLLSLTNISWTALEPREVSWGKCELAMLTTAPWWPLRGQMDKKAWAWYGGSGVTAVGLSWLTFGTLGRGLAEEATYPVYSAVQTIRLFGNQLRLEALVAAAVLMGSFCILLMVGSAVTGSVEKLIPGIKGKWAAAGVCVAAFLLEWGWRNSPWWHNWEIKAIFWVIFGVWALWVGDAEKVEKSEKSS